MGHILMGHRFETLGWSAGSKWAHLRVHVFSGSISAFFQNFMTQNKSAFGTVLGHAIAYKLGHLVIPGRARGGFQNFQGRSCRRSMRGWQRLPLPCRSYHIHVGSRSLAQLVALLSSESL